MTSIENVPEIESLLNCSICFGTFTQPKLLHCGHTFCLACLEKLADPEVEAITCPICNRNTIKPEEGLTGLPDDFRLNQIKDGLQAAATKSVKPTISPRKSSATKSQASRLCRACRSLSADVCCLQCHKVMCEGCLNKHNKRPDAARHTILKIEDLLECGDHEENCSHICRDCQRLVCTTCIIDKCSEHACAEIGETIRNYITSGELKQTRDEAVTTLAKFAETLQEILEKFTSLNKDVQSHCDTMVETVKEEHKRLINDMNNLRQGALDKLEVSRLSAQERRLKLDSVVDTKPEDLMNGIPSELLDAVLNKPSPGAEPANQDSSFRDINFKVQQKPEDLRLGKIQFRDDEDSVASQDLGVKGKQKFSSIAIIGYCIALVVCFLLGFFAQMFTRGTPSAPQAGPK